MSNHSPFPSPPPELFKQWQEMPRSLAFEAAYRAGADQELEACCKWLALVGYGKSADRLLRAARRPKPPSLKEQALEAQRRMWSGASNHDDWDLVRRALEALDD